MSLAAKNGGGQRCATKRDNYEHCLQQAYEPNQSCFVLNSAVVGMQGDRCA